MLLPYTSADILLRIQSVSKRWKELAWLCVTDLDTRAIVIEDKNSRGMCMGRLASRLNFGSILKITLGKEAIFLEMFV
jgi:hypothetical protein